MKILQKLKNNKGTVSSALGKSLAQEVLKGDMEILKEAVGLILFDDKNVRSGAGKIIEMVAEKKPGLIVPYLKKLLPALELPEPQTRWVILHAYGLCAKLKPDISREALPKAEQFLKEKSGMCLWDRFITYLGLLGAISDRDAQKVFPLLEKTLTTIPDRTARIFEGFERMVPVLNQELKAKLEEMSRKYVNNKSPSIKSKALRILKKISNHNQ
jgi:hypothetical protein